MSRTPSAAPLLPLHAENAVNSLILPNPRRRCLTRSLAWGRWTDVNSMKFGWTADWAALHKRYMFLSLALASTIALSVPGSAGGISGVFVQNDRVVVRFDDRVNGASAFLLDAPRRIALDIDGAQVGRGHFAPPAARCQPCDRGS